MLISDIVMPRCDGIQRARSLAALQPNMRTMFMTGFDDGLLEVQPCWKVIGKPFRPAELTAIAAAHLKSQFGQFGQEERRTANG